MTRPEVRRALGLVALAVALAVVCTGLGLWQYQRHTERSAAIALVQANYHADPVPLADVLASPDDALAPGAVWTPVRVTGRYLAGDTVLLRNRPVEGRPALHVLVPFLVTGPTGDGAGGTGDSGSGDGGAEDGAAGEGAVLVVDRGWVPGEAEAADAPPPAGTVEVVVRLRAQEPASRRDAPPGQVQSVSVPQVLAAAALPAGTPAYRAYGALVSETPSADRPLGALPRPSIDPGSHLSYAMQWWTFALGSLVGFTVLARRELAVPAAGDRPAPPRAPRRRRGPSAEDVEDALIDAQLR